MEKSYIEFYAKKQIGECDICLDDIERNDLVIVTVCCSHNFHKDCVKKLEKCPMCRGEHFIYKPKEKPNIVEKIVYRDRPRSPVLSRGSPRSYRGRTPPIAAPPVRVERLHESGPIPYDILMDMGSSSWAPVNEWGKIE